MVTCAACGADSGGASYCPRCGRSINVTALPSDTFDPPMTPAQPAAGAAPNWTPERAPEPEPLRATAPAPPPRSEGPNRLVFALLAAVLVLMAVVGFLLMSGGDDDTTATQPPGAADTGSSDNDDPTQGQSPNEDDPGSSKDPAEPDAQCWDGSMVMRAEQACPAPTSLEAMKWALPVDWSQCVVTDDAPYNQWSHTCVLRGARIHIAAYLGDDERNLRLSGYGSCISRAGGRVLCEPSASTDRYVRTYDERVLFYMSAASADYDVLNALPQRSAQDVLSGAAR